jgi:hypothetical protein
LESVKLTAGIQNLRDRNPPHTNDGAGFMGSDDRSDTDVCGRLASLTANDKF